ncbi:MULTISPECIES: LacI family DNA-binding transcriptional regulator [unclassified Actinomyces]|uniref:LacI family DNA-binding transcriptional regulator n=1 Tax=unclassified Actinomyces TaxID=2609248 RepID=UPI001373D79A|nr:MULTISPECIES: LacI family DNA-binding transcriptional regulator [unclassified Actinomyces]MBW3069485.1 LacI family transcriptional regulator [Actinomyces sp. 594]NDR52925.1 LacI family transcriptional regulator [Actinomyces sp. 565]QHO90472.1 LacI family transcriptional regulator [Actinomyces sp. 432]
MSPGRATDRVTIKDVAREAGVSVTTVSHALNNPEGSRVSEETRSHVKSVAAALGYRANPSARALRTRRTDTIALVGRQLATTEHLGRMVLGAQDAVRAHGGLLIVADTADDEDDVIGTLIDHQVDGIILGALYHQAVTVPSALAGIPTVVVNAFTSDPRYSWVVPDEVAGGRAGAEVLLASGHRRVAMINNHDDIPAAHGRAEGFIARCRESGVEPVVVSCKPAGSAAYDEAVRLLQAAPDERPTGVFCFADAMAMGVYAAAAQLGLRIPQDLSVVGFDDMILINESLSPRLTSIALPHAEMAAWAVERLYELLDTPGAQAQNLRIVGRVVERDSVARPDH